MAAEMKREHHNEEIYHPDIIFIRKKILPEEIKQELERLKNAFEDEKRKMTGVWQSTYEVVKERYKTDSALFQSKSLLPKPELEASTSDAHREMENVDASIVELGPDQAVDFYKIWIEEFRKNATKQQEVVGDSVEAWFQLLHLFDEEEQKQQPKQSVSENPMNKYIYNLSALVLFVACVLFIFQNYDLLKCNDAHYLVCLHEIVITLVFKIRNSYLKFHDITLDYLNLSDIGHLSKSGW